MISKYLDCPGGAKNELDVEVFLNLQISNCLNYTLAGSRNGFYKDGTYRFNGLYISAMYHKLILRSI